jgi:hypothetical protein
MKFTERIIGMVTKPDKTMNDIVNEPRIEEAILIECIYMILLIVGKYLEETRINYVGSIQGMSASTFNTALLIMGIISVIILVVVEWPVITGICHYISMVFGGNGKLYPNMMTAIGYTCLPLIIVAILSIIVTLMIPVTTINVGQGMQSTNGIISNPMVILSYIFTFFGAVATAFLMVSAVKYGERISTKSAYAVVGLLFVVNIVITFGSLIMALI